MNSNPNTGYTIEAEYTDQVLKEYQGNPLIEALPPIFSFEQAEELLHIYPDYEGKERRFNSHERYHCIQRLFSYFQPWDKHFDVEQRISRVIRQGYISRNPLKPEYASDLQKIYRMIKAGDYNFKNSELSPVTASGFTIIGFSGVGKTKAVERVLSLYPQIVIHAKYNSQDLNHYQLTWLKLDCPHDGSVKGLCANFFLEIDRLFGENTYNKFAAGRNTTTDTMIPRMAQMARRFSLGVLVIDEIQHLSVAKSGGQEKMLNFFVNLVNTIGIPVILIGTSKAMSILQGEFRQARRGSGHQGDLIWENMSKDDSWDLLIEGMWEYQWTSKQISLTQDIKDKLYEESQGIVDIAIKLYAMAQMRAIVTGKEIITPGIIEQVAKDNLKLVRPMLLALKSGNMREIEKYGDIKPVDIEVFCSEQLKMLNLNEKLRQKQSSERQKKDGDYNLLEKAVMELVEYKVDPEQAKRVVRQLIDNSGNDIEVNDIVKEALKAILREELGRESQSKKRSLRIEKSKDSDDLRFITEEGRKDKLSAYEALKSRGYIKCPVEEFKLLG